LRKLISVVISAYNEQECVQELARRLQGVFVELSQYDFEVILVENGSHDATYPLMLTINASDSRFKLVQLARNFGMDGGITAGLAYARGDAAVIMTADLQDPPELILEFVAKWEEGYENVYGIVTSRVGTGVVRRANSKLFYMLANRLTDQGVPPNVSDFRLVDRRVYETINRMSEHNRFLRGMFAWVGYRSIGIEHRRQPRFGGRSKAGTLHVLDLATRGILSNTSIPLKVIPFLGLGIASLSFIALLIFTFKFIFFGVPFAGFGTIVGISLLLFGLLFIIIGVLAQYVGLIYDEVKQRPNFIVRDTVGIEVRESAASGDAPAP
jgi:glycosyltransferase involved in cell wall biosynthesis